MTAPLSKNRGVAREQMRLALNQLYNKLDQAELIEALLKMLDAVDEKSVEPLREHVKWCANTVHQAHHAEGPWGNVNWMECSHGFCASARRVLETAVMELPSDGVDDSGTRDPSWP